MDFVPACYSGLLDRATVVGLRWLEGHHTIGVIGMTPSAHAMDGRRRNTVAPSGAPRAAVALAIPMELVVLTAFDRALLLFLVFL